MGLDIIEVKMYVLPGGKMPERQSKGAIGYDVFTRAIVSPFKMDSKNSKLRKTLFDFQGMPGNKELAAHIRKVKNGDGERLIYILHPRERVLVGIGFITEMPFPWFYWVAPRSGLASKWGITVGNAPGTVDPDYRGEAGVVLINNGEEDFELEYGMRIAQIIFQKAEIPRIIQVKTYKDLDMSQRGAGAFGSTGMK